MNRADLWAGTLAPNPQRGNTEIRGYDTARLIGARPFTVVITRPDPLTNEVIVLPPQVVRLEVLHPIRGASEQIDNLMNELSVQYGVLVGFKQCPGIPDTDVQRADQFPYGGLLYEVTDFINAVPGILLATLTIKP